MASVVTIISLLLYVLVKVSFCEDFVLPEVDGFHAEGNMIYGFELCLRNNMSLPILEDREKIEMLSTFMEDKKIYRAWTGANDMGEEGRFRWLNNGQRIKNFVWHQGQPDNSYQTEDCVEFNKYQTTWAWNDLNCDTKLAIICEVSFDIDIRRLFRTQSDKNTI